MEEAAEDIALSVKDISKKFKTGKNADPFWALTNVNFDVKKGEILGIIGHNGAGKSTLLKILAEIIAPTTGFARYNGTILPILDIGTGFHPDLSGYKNIFLNGSILGINKQKMARKVDEIISFSGLAEHIYEPVKNYSKGMYLRLALSIALFTDNDILLLDEVLSVGDVEFRHKAILQVKLQAQQGKTCILVSHDLSSIVDICDECLMMEKGAIVARGKPKAIVEKYYHIFYNKLKDAYPVVLDHAICQLFWMRAEKDIVNRNEAIVINIKYELKENFDLKFYLRLKNFHSNVLTASPEFEPEANTQIFAPGTYQTSCRIPPELLSAGNYMVDIMLCSEDKVLVEYNDACRFKVLLDEWEKDKIWNSPMDLFPVRPHCEWNVGQPIAD